MIIVSRPLSPPGAKCSMFTNSGCTTSTPERFSDPFFISSCVDIIRIDFGVLYLLPLLFPRPALICVPFFDR